MKKKIDHFLIWEWWKERVEEGRQLLDLDEWNKGWDYRSPNPSGWCVAVATGALFQEYNRDHSGNPLVHSHFTCILREVIGANRVKSMEATLVVDDFSITNSRRFVFFKGLNYYKGRLHSDSYYACFA